MKTPTIKLTFSNRSLAAIRPPAKGRTYVYDAKQPGLCLMITANDARSFYLYRHVQGRPKRIRLGGFDEITVGQARIACRKLVASVTAARANAAGNKLTNFRCDLAVLVTFEKEELSLYKTISLPFLPARGLELDLPSEATIVVDGAPCWHMGGQYFAVPCGPAIQIVSRNQRNVLLSRLIDDGFEQRESSPERDEAIFNQHEGIEKST